MERMPEAPRGHKRPSKDWSDEVEQGYAVRRFHHATRLSEKVDRGSGGGLTFHKSSESSLHKSWGGDL